MWSSVASAWLLALLMSPETLFGVVAQRLDLETCQWLDFDSRKCGKLSPTAEIRCIAQGSSMKELVDCVKLKDQDDEELCRDITERIIDDYYPPDVFPPSLMEVPHCIVPRQVLITGIDVVKCPDCTLRGIFQACPRDDPHYFTCVCTHYWVTRDHLEACARCFNTDSLSADLMELDCEKLLTKRAFVPEEVNAEPRALEAVNKWHTSIEIPDLNYDIYIASSLKGYYFNKRTRILGGLPLQYIDVFEPSPSDTFERCYISPWYPWKHCRRLRIPSSWGSPTATHQPSKATYRATSTYTDTVSSIPTEAALPGRRAPQARPVPLA